MPKNMKPFNNILKRVLGWYKMDNHKYSRKLRTSNNLCWSKTLYGKERKEMCRKSYRVAFSTFP